jgi:hypothetical protein
MAQRSMGCQWATSSQCLKAHFQACLVVCGFHFFPSIAVDEWFESIVCNQSYHLGLNEVMVVRMS